MTDVGDIAASLLMFEVPGGTQLTPKQNAGSACVWCGNDLPAGAGIDLGGVGGWSPRGCLDCYLARRSWLETYNAWRAHLPDCEACRAAAVCATAGAFQRQLLDVRRRAGKPPVTCVRCAKEVLPDERFEPLVWDGLSGPLFGYTHVGICISIEPRWRFS